jgi:TPR repeat protein
MMFALGVSVPKDLDQATKWLEAASANGFGPAARAIAALNLE